MTGLQETFYIMAIVFMSLTFLLIIALVIAVLVIRAKVNKIHEVIDQKLNSLTGLAERGGELAATAGSTIKRAKRVLAKAKK